MAIMQSNPRPLYLIADEIKQLWPKPYFGAVPYLKALGSLSDKGDTYGYDSAKTIVLYLLSNMGTFKGPDARRIKAELKQVIAS